MASVPAIGPAPGSASTTYLHSLETEAQGSLVSKGGGDPEAAPRRKTLVVLTSKTFFKPYEAIRQVCGQQPRREAEPPWYVRLRSSDHSGRSLSVYFVPRIIHIVLTPINFLTLQRACPRWAPLLRRNGHTPRRSEPRQPLNQETGTD